MKKDIQFDGLKVIMYSMLLTEAIDDLKGTTLYKQHIKKAGNNFAKMLEPYVKQFDTVYDADPTLTTNLLNQSEALFEKILKRNLVDITMINQIHDHYKDNQEDWKSLFDVYLTKLEN